MVTQKKQPPIQYQSLQTELTEIMALLQQEGLDIDETIRLYQRGLEITEILHAYLETAQNKITELKAAYPVIE